MLTSWIRFFAGLVLLVGLSHAALAESSDIVVTDAWSRASIGQSRPGAAYMVITNTGGDPVTLTGITTDLAGKPEIHLSATNDQGVSSMAPAGEITIAPGASIELKPGGLHAMLMMLTQPMVRGETFSLTLVFAGGREVVVDVPILSLRARGPGE
jgi:copper(I)-binding protein